MKFGPNTAWTQTDLPLNQADITQRSCLPPSGCSLPPSPHQWRCGPVLAILLHYCSRRVIRLSIICTVATRLGFKDHIVVSTAAPSNNNEQRQHGQRAPEADYNWWKFSSVRLVNCKLLCFAVAQELSPRGPTDRTPRLNHLDYL